MNQHGFDAPGGTVSLFLNPTEVTKKEHDAALAANGGSYAENTANYRAIFDAVVGAMVEEQGVDIATARQICISKHPRLKPALAR